MYESRTHRRFTAFLFAALAGTAAFGMPATGLWSTPVNLETLPGSAGNINTPAVDGCASLSPDGLDIAFTSNRTGDFDIYMAHRTSTDAGFGAAYALPAPVNGPTWDYCPSLLRGKRLVYGSQRDDPLGDLYETRLGPKGWSQPRRFGPNINEDGVLEEVAAVYEDHDGREVMIFTKRPGGGAGKLYQSIDGGPATLVQGGPHSSASDVRASVTHDGKTLYWDSTRGGGAPAIWTASRSSTRDVWGQAFPVPELSSQASDLRPQISWDGTMITMSSNRPGSESPAPDIWYATRNRTPGG